MSKTKMNCDDPDLQDFLHNQSVAPDAAVMEHIEHCSACQERLESLAAEEQMWQRAGAALGKSSSQPTDWDSTVSIGVQRFRVASDDSPQWNDAMARQLLAAPTHPEMLGRLGRYEVESLLGSGGMGIVFKAFDTELNRPVAIKLLAPHLARSQSARTRFSREARAAAGIVDDHVVPIYNVDSEAESPFLVMQYVAGGSLQQRLDCDGPLELCEILRIGLQTAQGLAAAHAQGLIHRDVKPSNVLLDEDVSRALLSDFGLARADDDQQLTHSGFHPGTPQYMSPEQVRGESLDGRSDLFSLGCLLHALCTGTPPFRGNSSFATLRMITDEPTPSISEKRPELADWLNTIVKKLLEKSPENRYQSASEVAALLKSCLAHVRRPTTCPLPQELQEAEGTGNRAPRRAIVAAGFFSFLLILASITIIIDWKKGQIRFKFDEANGNKNSPRLKVGEPARETEESAGPTSSVAAVYLMHPGELKNGNSIQQMATTRAISELRNQDYCGVLTYTPEGTQWLGGGVTQLAEEEVVRLFGLVKKMRVGDLPEFDTALQLAWTALEKLEVQERRLVVFTDGDPVLSNKKILERYKDSGVKIDVVHVEIHDASYRTTPSLLAEATGGEYVLVTSQSAMKSVPEAMTFLTRDCIALAKKSTSNVAPLSGASQLEKWTDNSSIATLTVNKAIRRGKELWHSRQRVRIQFKIGSALSRLRREADGEESEWVVLKSKAGANFNDTNDFYVWVPVEFASDAMVGKWIEVEGIVVGSRTGGKRLANDPRPDIPLFSISVESPNQMRIQNGPIQSGRSMEMETELRTQALLTQVIFTGDAINGATIKLLPEGKFQEEQLYVPARKNFRQERIYHLEISQIPGHEGLRLFPTLEVRAVSPATSAYLQHNAVPFEITPDDLDQIGGGKFVTKVIYLPDPDSQTEVIGGVATVASYRLDLGIDPVKEAELNGNILLIMRMGSKKSEDSKTRESERTRDKAVNIPKKSRGLPIWREKWQRESEDFMKAMKQIESGGDRLRQAADKNEDGTYVMIPLNVSSHPDATMKHNLGRRVNIVIDGENTPDSSPNATDRIQKGLLYDCRLESFKLFTLGGQDYWLAQLFVPRKPQYRLGSLWYRDTVRELRIGDRHTPVPAATLTQEDPKETVSEALGDFELRLDNSQSGAARLTVFEELGATGQASTSISRYWVQSKPAKVVWSSKGSSEFLKDNSIQLQGPADWQEFAVHLSPPALAEITHVRLEILTSEKEKQDTDARMMLFEVKPSLVDEHDGDKPLEFESCQVLGDPKNAAAANCIDHLSDSGWTVPETAGKEACHSLILELQEPVRIENGKFFSLRIDSGGAPGLKTLPRVRVSFSGKRLDAE